MNVNFMHLVISQSFNNCHRSNDLHSLNICKEGGGREEKTASSF